MNDAVQSGASEVEGEELLSEINAMCAAGARDQWRTIGLICAAPVLLTGCVWLIAVLTQ